MTKTSLRTNDIVKMVNLNILQKTHIGTNDIVYYQLLTGFSQKENPFYVGKLWKSHDL